MFKRFFSRESNKLTSQTSKRDRTPLEHNRLEFDELVKAIQLNNRECDALTRQDLEVKFKQFAEQNRLGVSTKSDYISQCSPERLQRLLASSYYSSTIKSGIQKMQKEDANFSWEQEKDVVGALFVDRGFFILVHAVNRKVGFNRRWVFDFYLASRHFA